MSLISLRCRARARHSLLARTAQATFRPLVGCLLLLAITSAPARAAPLTLTAAETRLMAGNPALAGAEQRIRALQRQADAATRLPDPKVSLDASNLPTNNFSLTQQATTMLSVGVSQEFPAFGKLALQGRSLQAQASEQRYGRAAQRAVLALALRRAWLAAVYTRKAATIVREQQGLAAQSEQASLASYRSARIPQSDVLRAKLALEELRNDLDVLRADESAQLARIAQLLGVERAPDIDGHWPDLSAPPADPQAALASQPLLQQARAKVHANAIAVRLARKAYEPSFTVGASYGKSFMPGSPNFVSVGVSFNVPLFAGRRIDDEVDVAGARELEARFAEQDQRLALVRQMRDAQARWRSLRDKWSRETTRMLPLARQAQRATLSAYASGQGSLGDVLKAQQAVFTTQIQVLQDRRDLLATQAELDYLTQAPQEGQP